MVDAVHKERGVREIGDRIVQCRAACVIAAVEARLGAMQVECDAAAVRVAESRMRAERQRAPGIVVTPYAEIAWPRTSGTRK